MEKGIYRNEYFDNILVLADLLTILIFNLFLEFLFVCSFWVGLFGLFKIYFVLYQKFVVICVHLYK